MKHVWLIGLGGIGQALLKYFEQASINVTVFSSQSSPSFDITNEQDINEYVLSASLLPDAIIITSGVLYDEQHMPEKSITSLDTDWLTHSIRINVLTTLYFSKAITKRLRPSDKLMFASFSARVSSISDNRLGGWHSYRMSKAMLNMLIKNVAIEWRTKSLNAVIFGYHPGTVDTTLSKPFQSRLKTNHPLLTPEDAARYFVSCLSSKTLSDSGKLFDWQQQEIMP